MVCLGHLGARVSKLWALLGVTRGIFFLELSSGPSLREMALSEDEGTPRKTARYCNPCSWHPQMEPLFWNVTCAHPNRDVLRCWRLTRKISSLPQGFLVIGRVLDSF